MVLERLSDKLFQNKIYVGFAAVWSIYVSNYELYHCHYSLWELPLVPKLQTLRNDILVLVFDLYSYCKMPFSTMSKHYCFLSNLLCKY